MKQVKKALFLVLMGALAFTYSCTKDDTTVAAPTLTVSVDKTSAKAGDVVKLTIQATTTETLKEIKVQEQAAGSSSYTTLSNGDTMISGTNVTWVYSYTVPSGATGKLQVIAYDNGSRSTTKAVTFTVTGSLSTYTSKVLGDQNNSSIGSFFSASDGLVYLSGQANSNQSKIDLIYYNGSTNKVTFAGPGSTQSPGVKDFSAFGLTSWSVKNKTMFKVSSASTYTSCTDGAAIIAAYNASSATATEEANMLTNGSVILFQTIGGQYGILKITALDTSAGGSVTIDVKVSQ